MSEAESRTHPMNLGAAISMGVGAMVGAGIFALMGEAGARAGNAVYISFILAGLISLLSGYSYAKLGVRYPSSGGIVEYLAQSYGSGYVTGVVSVILYFSVTIVMAMVARAFGNYAAALFTPHSPALLVNMFASGIVILLAFINAVGSDVVGKLEKFIVTIKISILALFIIASLVLMNPGLLSMHGRTPPVFGTVSTVAICLLAYHGFGVITNTVEDMPNPAWTLPRALYGAIAIVIVVYVGAAFAVFGNLPLAEVIRAKDYAMAEAARPVLGQLGFTIIALAALLSAASSVNANLYSTANITLLLAKDGELPQFEGRKIWQAGTGGLLTTAIIILLLANFLNLEKIASLGSIVYLVVYTTVHLGHFIRLTRETGASKPIIAAAFFVNLCVLIVFVLDTEKKQPVVLFLLFAFVIVSILVELYMQRIRKRTIKRAF